MMKMMSKELFDKEKQSEDYCFVCKDGGHIRICDHRDCTKSYHPECVNRDPSFLNAAETWACAWHSCFNCHKKSTFRCFCCPKSFCGKCVRKADFSQVKGAKGFCSECLRLAKLVEDCADTDSEEVNVDFDDRNTWEFLFKDYWPIVKRQEGLTKENVRYADALFNGCHHAKDWLDSDVSSEQLEEVSDSEDFEDDYENEDLLLTDDLELKRERKNTQKNKPKFGKFKFAGCYSTELVKFLSILGKETKEPPEKFDVFKIVRDYIHSNGLLHCDKRGRKYVISDLALHCLIRRRKFKLHRLQNLLDRHFTSSDGSLDEFSSSDEESYAKSRKRRKLVIGNSKIRSNSKVRCDSVIKSDWHDRYELNLEPPKSCFAEINISNIKAVYLKRSLIVELLEDPSTFETKIIGCFVRVKTDPKDLNCMPGKLYLLGQVTEVKKAPQEYKFKEMSTDIVLCISNITMDVNISMLSDDDFEEEECKDLHQLVEVGLFQRPSIVELEKKLRTVHEAIVKHSIKKELMKLDRLIERANEKGWRKELYEYMDKKKQLSMPEEVTRLIKELPKIAAASISQETSLIGGNKQ